MHEVRASGAGAEGGPAEPLPADAPAAVEAAVAAALAVSPEPEPPPYPWPMPEPGPEEKLREAWSRRVSLDMSDADGRVFLDLFPALGLPLVVDPPLEDALAAKPYDVVALRLRDITAKNALELVISQGHGVEMDPLADDAAGALRVTTRERAEAAWAEWRERPAAVPSRAEMIRAVLADESRGRGRWVEVAHERLRGTRVTLDLPDSNLHEAARILARATLFNYVISQRIDAVARPVRLRCGDATAWDATTALCRAAGAEIRWWLDREAVIIGDGRAGDPPLPLEPAPLPPGARVEVALFRATVPDLVRALEAQEIEVIVGERAWASRGTFSLWSGPANASATAAAISGRTALRAEWIGRDAIVIEGELPSVRAALEATPPEGLAGALPGWRGLREKLARLVLDREAARSASRFDRAAVERLEREVSLAAGELSDHVRRLHEVAGARERLAALEPRTARAERDLAAAEAEVARARAAVEEVVVPPESEDAAAAREARRERARRAIPLALALTRADALEADLLRLRPDVAAARRDVLLLEAYERGEDAPAR